MPLVQDGSLQRDPFLNSHLSNYHANTPPWLAPHSTHVNSHGQRERRFFFSTELGVPTVEHLGGKQQPRLCKGLVTS